MSSSSKTSESSSSIVKLKNPPFPFFDIHIWVDYVELLCLVNVDQEISRADVLDRIRETEDLDINQAENDDDTEYDKHNDDILPAKENDIWAQRATDWFRHLSYRVGAFGEFYPFVVSEDRNILSLKKNDITVKQKLYIFLLLSSNLRCIIRQHWGLLTSSFELVSREALKSCLPDEAAVYFFGSSNSLSEKIYEGNLWQKINKLADDIREKVIINEDKFSSHNVGDNGADIVAWVPMGDTTDGLVIVFGQCACTEEWVKKQHSSSPDAWRAIMPFKASPNNMTFIPFCFRSSDGSWHKPQDIHGSILVDRLRFVHLLRNKNELVKNQPFHKLVDEILKYDEPLF